MAREAERGLERQTNADKEMRQLDLHVFPRIGGKPVRELTSRDLLQVLQRIEARKGGPDGSPGTAQPVSPIMQVRRPDSSGRHRPVRSPEGRTRPRAQQPFCRRHRAEAGCLD